MIIEIFSCSGGMAEGLRREGLDVEMAFDKDENACASYKANLHHAPVQMDARDVLRMVSAGWRPARAIDLFVADPPCTPWSRAGKRQGQADERDMLAVTVELVSLLRPRAWLIANVPGLDDGPNWPTVQKTIGSLAAGSRYCIDFVRLDAANYGVPQHRVRPFWFGHAHDSPHIAWPAPTHCDPKTLGNGHLPGTELAPWLTCRQALAHLAAEDLGSPVRLRWRGSKGNQVASVPDRPARVVGTSTLSDGNVLAHPTEAFRKAHKPSKKPRATHMDEPAGVVQAKDRNDNGTVVFDGPDHRPSKADEPARTLTRNTHSDGALLQMEADDEVVFTGCEDHPGPAVLILRERDDGSIRESTLDAPAHTLRGGRSSSERLITEVPHHPPSELDSPSRTIRAGTAGTPDKILTTNDRHPPNELDAPSVTIGAKGDRGGQGGTVLVTGKHPVSESDEPAMTVAASDGGGSKKVMSWPWDRPSTTVQRDDRIPPPGHHDLSFRSRSLPNAVKLSEKAAAILQGFPEAWVFVGKTKRARWSQLGQAMPPPLAAAVARAIKRQMAAADAAATSRAADIRDAARHRA